MNEHISFLFVLPYVQYYFNFSYLTQDKTSHFYVTIYEIKLLEKKSCIINNNYVRVNYLVGSIPKPLQTWPHLIVTKPHKRGAINNTNL